MLSLSWAWKKVLQPRALGPYTFWSEPSQLAYRTTEYCKIVRYRVKVPNRMRRLSNAFADRIHHE